MIFVKFKTPIIYIYLIDDGIEMPLQSMDNFVNFDSTLDKQEIAKKFVSYFKGYIKYQSNNSFIV